MAVDKDHNKDHQIEVANEISKANQNSNNNNNHNVVVGPKGRSCKGCLYYSSLHKSKSQRPACFGLSKTIPHVSRHMVGEMELEASQEGRNLRDFKYACIGYSVYLDNKDNTSDLQNKPAELPLCVGLEILMDKRTENAHAQSHRGEDTRALPQPRTRKPTTATEDEFFSRFKRNASLVASGVAKNINKVANHVKQTFDDIVYPYRRRPK